MAPFDVVTRRVGRTPQQGAFCSKEKQWGSEMIADRSIVSKAMQHRGPLGTEGELNRAERYSPCGSVLCTGTVVYSCHPLSAFRPRGFSSPTERVIASCRRFESRESSLGRGSAESTRFQYLFERTS